jgi:hypothetical protein
MNDHPMNQLDLSPDGKIRRAAMKSELQARMGSIHRSRRRRRTLAATGLAVALTVSLGVAGWRAMVSDAIPREPGARLAGNDSIEPVNGGDDAQSGVVVVSRAGGLSTGLVRRVETDPSAVERWRARTSDFPAVAVEWIRGDTELLDALAAADHPTGLIRMEGRVRFTNPELN